MIKHAFASVGWFLRVSKARKKPSDGMRIAAEKAELDVLDAIKEMPEVISAWHALRIQDPTRRIGAGEIDVLALTTKGFALIEVKHWTGSIQMVDGDIVQEKLQRKRPVFEPLEKKAANLKRCARSLIREDALEVTTIVALTNSNAEASDEVLQHPGVATLKSLSEKINRRFSNHEPLSPHTLNNYAELAACFGTWDSLEFEGGATHIGDFDDQLMPQEWRREKYQSIEISIAHGFWKTMALGPKLSIRLTSWDGNVTVESLTPPLFIKHTSPWEKGGVDGRGHYPVSYLRTITYGFQYESLGQYHARRLEMNLQYPTEGPSISTNDKEVQLKRKHNDAGRSAKVDYSQKFSPGTRHKGTIVKHLIGDDGIVYALLIALVERKVTGMLKMKELNHLNPEMFQVFYAEGKPVDVQVLNYNGQKNIQLTTR
jgi:hypothetical protein